MWSIKLNIKREGILCLFLLLVILGQALKVVHMLLYKSKSELSILIFRTPVVKKTPILSYIADGFLWTLRHCGCSEIRKMLCVLSFFYHLTQAKGNWPKRRVLLWKVRLCSGKQTLHVFSESKVCDFKLFKNSEYSLCWDSYCIVLLLV